MQADDDQQEGIQLTSMHAADAPAGATFMSLPPEIRNIIYLISGVSASDEHMD
jgi:hypothetical protein